MRLPRGMAPAGPPKEAVRRDGPVRFQCGAVRVRLRWRVLLGKRRAHPRGQTDRRHGLVRLRRRLLPRGLLPHSHPGRVGRRGGLTLRRGALRRGRRTRRQGRAVRGLDPQAPAVQDRGLPRPAEVRRGTRPRPKRQTTTRPEPSASDCRDPTGRPSSTVVALPVYRGNCPPQVRGHRAGSNYQCPGSSRYGPTLGERWSSLMTVPTPPSC